MTSSEDRSEGFSFYIPDEYEQINTDEKEVTSEITEEPRVDKLLINYPEYKMHLGNFEYMPSKFHGLVTKDFGMTYNRYDKDGNRIEQQDHPFLQLKQIVYNSSIELVDRTQAVRYMCFIPYLNAESHLYDVIDHILFDDSIDIYKRYHFFSNNEKYLKLNDSIVHRTYPLFFQTGIKLKYPFELLILSARYILSFYGVEHDIRQEVLDWLLDVVNDVNEEHRSRAEAADVLITCGEPDEIEYGNQMIQVLGQKENDIIYTDQENVHSDSFIHSTRNIIRALQKDHLASLINNDNTRDVPSLTEEMYNSILSTGLTDEEQSHLQKFIYRIQTDSTKFERLTLLDIMHLVWNKVKTLEKEKYDEAIKRILEEANDSVGTCTTGYLVRIMNIIQGLVQGEEFQLKMDPKDEIRSAVFARLNSSLREVSVEYREQVLTSMEEGGGQVIRDFVNIYDPTEDLWEEYNEILDKKRFDEIVSQSINQYIGL
jgi:hypothetical protein